MTRSTEINFSVFLFKGGNKLIGIDISEHNGNINFTEVIKNVDFAIIRIGYGVSYLPDKQKDKFFERNYAGLHGKIPIGIYYYSYAKKPGDGTKEAKNCLLYLMGKHLDLPIFYDVEDDSMGSVNEVTREFVDFIKKSGYQAGVYSYKYWCDSKKLDLSKFNDCMKWVAAYGNNTGSISGPRPAGAEIWQYTSRGRIAGINGNVDMNTTDKTFYLEGAKMAYYDEAWKKAKEMCIVDSSLPTEKPDKGWIIYILYKVGLIK